LQTCVPDGVSASALIKPRVHHPYEVVKAADK